MIFGANDFSELVPILVTAINGLVIVLMGVALITFIWGLIRYIANSGNEKERANGRYYMIYGIVAFAVIGSLWGLVAILTNIVGFNFIGPQFPIS